MAYPAKCSRWRVLREAYQQMAASALVQGSELFWAEVKSPLIIAVIASTFLVGLLAYAYYKSKPGRRGRAIISLIAALSIMIIIPAAFYVTMRPGVEYGAVLEDHTLTVTYYGSVKAVFNVCNSSVELLPVGKALDLLKVRTNGLADPATGVYMGHFRTTDGKPAAAIVWTKTTGKAIVVDDGRRVAVIGVKGVENLYKAIIKAKQACSP